MVDFETATSRDVLSLQNWTSGNACISIEEAEYLKHLDDLMAIGSASEDRAAGWLETCVENLLIRLSRISRKVKQSYIFGEAND
jgi:hypothetical protein